MVYVTCSVLPEEDEDRVAAFLARTPGFVAAPATADPKLTAIPHALTASCACRPAPPARTAFSSPCWRNAA